MRVITRAERRYTPTTREKVDIIEDKKIRVDGLGSPNLPVQ